MKRIPSFFFLPLMMVALASCSGGGGGGGSDGTGADTGGDGSSGGGVVSGTSTVWRAQAAVSVDGCGERISPVTQSFTVTRDGDNYSVNDTLVTLTGTGTSDGFTVGFTGQSGSCVRDYEAQFSGMTDTTANVHFVVKSTCGATVCQNEWTGTATVDGSASKTDETMVEKTKVTGPNCVPPVPQIGYRPSTFECFGNASVLARDYIRSAYSIVVRRNGQYNDRDPNNTSCGTNRCSPYKTQQKIELPAYQVNCLGATGYSSLYDPVTRISVKFTADVQNSSDPHQFQQYCLNSRQRDLN